MLSKKHYVEIALILRVHKNEMKSSVAKELTRDIADYFERDNPLFDRERFYTACGV